MTPEELNTIVNTVIDALNGGDRIGTVSAGVPADADGTIPEIYAEVGGADVLLTVSPL